MERGTEQGYFPDPAKYLLILDTPVQEEEGLALNLVSGSRYLGYYLGPQEELAAWVKPKVEAWAHWVRVLGKISRRHPQLDYAGLRMSLQLKWK